MEEEEKEVINICKEFVKKADSLETKGFNDRDYQEKGFVQDFNKLFEEYCHGKQNRTVSGLNFRQPPRYSNINTAKN